MVTFICECCDKTLKKKQVQGHLQGKCFHSAIICIDCHKTFDNQDYKTHLQCISQQDKHWGQFAPQKKNKKIGKQPKGYNIKNNHVKTIYQENHNKLQNNHQKEIDNSGIKEPEDIDQQVIDQQKQPQNKYSTSPKSFPLPPQNRWKGWKNEIKEIIKSHDNKIQKQQLKNQIKKIYTQKNQNLLPNQQFQSLFQDKLTKIKNIKSLTYYTIS